MKNDKVSFYRVENIIYNRKDFGILLAQAIKKTGKFSRKEATKLWKKLKNEN